MSTQDSRDEEVTGETQPQSGQQALKGSIGNISARELIILAAIAAIFLLVLFFIESPSFIKEKVSQPVSSVPSIVEPEAKAAFKYFPEGGNAPDFRDESNGPVEVVLTREEDFLILDWDASVKTSVVKVFDLGELSDLNDTQEIWSIAADNEVYITSPYEVGTLPSGFSLTQGLPINLQLETGKRYTIELLAINADGLPTLGTYTFTY